MAAESFHQGFTRVASVTRKTLVVTNPCRPDPRKVVILAPARKLPVSNLHDFVAHACLLRRQKAVKHDADAEPVVLMMWNVNFQIDGKPGRNDLLWVSHRPDDIWAIRVDDPSVCGVMKLANKSSMVYGKDFDSK
eukprot:693256-Prorocentrum_minimum.AAC.45